MKQAEYHSIQEHSELIKGEMRTQVKEVHVEDGKGTVEVRYLDPKGKVLAKHAEQLSPLQIRRILEKRFVPDLFNKCLVGCGTAAQEQTPRNAAKLRRTRNLRYRVNRQSRRNN